MKKVLALVLTLAMLLSCLAIGLSAALVQTKNETTHHYWSFTGGNAYNPIALTNTPSAFTLSFDLKFEESTQGSHGLMTYGSLKAPYIDFNAKTIGVDGKTLSYSGTWEEGVWYTFTYVTDGSNTTISCDGTEIGTVSSGLDNTQIFAQWRDVGIDNIKTSDGASTTYFSQDFENGGISGQGAIATYTTTTYTNTNEYNVPTNKYWQWDAENAYMYTQKLYSSSDLSDNGIVTVELDLRLDADTAKVNNYAGSFSINNEANTIGVGSATASYNFETNVWYHLKFDVYSNGASNIFVDGNLAGTLVGAVDKQPCAGMILVSMDNLKVSAGGAVINSEDFEDGDFGLKGDSNGAIATAYETTVRQLGNKYGNAPDNGCYMFQKIGSSSNYPNTGCGYTFDFSPKSATSRVVSLVPGSYASPVISVADGTIGINSTTVSYTFTPGEWYTITFDASKYKGVSGTDIYVDGVKIGNVATAINVEICITAYDCDFDNVKGYYVRDDLSVKTQFSEDFEDGTWDAGGDGNAFTVYNYAIPDERPIDQYFTKGTVGGDATLIEVDPDTTSNYIELNDCASGTANVAYNFDLCLLPNSDTADCFLELWTNTASRRWKVGTTFTGRDSDLTTFDWGTPGKDNFHNVTIGFKDGEGEIFVDGDLVYTGASGTVWTTTTLLMSWNASIIIDNFQMMTTDTHEAISCNFRNDNTKTVNMDAEDFCATNGHITGVSAVTTEATCYSEGVLTTTCAICGETAYTTAIDMVEHDWAKYDMSRKTDDGLVYTYCTNDGCTERRYTTIPDAADYTGNLYQFYDMQDDMVNVIDNDWDAETWTAADGVLEFVGLDNNYNLFSIHNDNVKPNDWTWSFDFNYQGTYDNAGTSQYGHTIYFWIGGSNTIFVQAGYDADNGKLFIRPNDGASFVACTADFTFVEGETYNVGVKYTYNRDTSFAGCYLMVNGEVKVAYDAEDDAIWNLPYSADLSKLDYAVLRVFGVNFTLDNMAFGNADFKWNRAYAGDLDGDFAITAADALLMRKFLAKVTTSEGLVTSRMDANNDGAVNAKDQLLIRIAIA